METFKKRQKEMRRLEKARDKAAKRKELKARKAAGIVEPSDETPMDEALQAPDTETAAPTPPSPSTT